MKIRASALLWVAVFLASCATVRQDDLKAWQGAPVSALDTHPVFLTMQVVKTRTNDGIEIRNYVNGRAVASCSGGGSVLVNSYINLASYNQFTNCMQGFAACNNIFYISNGQVQRYTPIGTGGAKCYTNDTVRPGFSGATNVR